MSRLRKYLKETYDISLGYLGRRKSLNSELMAS